ncbi:MAG: glutathione-disulfide reductase [Magnetovibrio sp.]|nr:glutathione-disulfide reductase [Magnetovibrio sp.]|tara:strand:+ start:1355 stop:2716 length:1362 start_codon:yes stop_codon:yes gene_type:complete
MTRYDYDLIVIGAGSGGVRASRFASLKYGKRVAVVEKNRVGGTCVMRGCVPKKLLVYGAHFAETFQDAQGYGWSYHNVDFSWSKLIEAKETELNRLEMVYHRLLKDAGVDELMGTGTLIDAHTVDVDGTKFTAEHILLAMGGWPRMPDIPGISNVITSNEALELEELPKQIAIVGGGYIAVEFAGIFNALGVDVRLIIRRENVLRGFDSEVCATLRDEMTKKGIDIISERKVISIAQNNKKVALQLDQGDQVDSDLVMYATGRRPNTANLGLEEVGVKLSDKGAIIVDAYSNTAIDSIYAIGDATDRINLTPVALHEGMAVTQTLYEGTPTAVDYTNVPSAVFSQPPVCSVGMTESEARQQNDIDVYKSNFKPMLHTLSGRDERTMMKLIVARQSDKVLGVHMVGPDAPEVIQGFAVALKSGATKAQFDATIGIHPTAAEEFVTMREPASETL